MKAESVAKVEAVGPDRFHMDLALPENAFGCRRAASGGSGHPAS